MSRPATTWSNAWGSLRTLRVWYFVLLIAFLPLIFMLAPVLSPLMPGIPRAIPGLLGATILMAGVGRALWHFKCPRCQQPFGGWFGDPWPDSCDYCGLRSFAEPAEISASFEVRAIAGGKPVIVGIRRTVAALEVVSGVAIAVLYGWAMLKFGGLPGWPTIFIESFAVLSVIAGVHLWQDHGVGYELSKAVQAMQILRFNSPVFGFSISTGPELLIGWSPGGFVYNLGIHASLSIGLQAATMSYVALNVIAIGIFLLLVRGHKAVRNAERRPPQPDATVSETVTSTG